MTILVTGGAGYVGSIVTEQLLKEGHQVVVLDNLQQGHTRAVPEGAAFVPGDILDSAILDEVFRSYRLDAVMHMAAETVVGFSITDPKRHFQTNVVGGVSLLDAMLEYDVARLVFSSTAAVYGEPASIPIDEEHRKEPLNAYGESKVMFERILDWYERAYGLKHISLRYFNAAGATDALGEDHRPETHLIPNVLRAALDKTCTVPVLGTDYPTSDGTCVRDYVHVVDIARAHVLALAKLEQLAGSAYNLGSNKGYSVREIVAMAREVTGVPITIRACERRPGDPAVLVASASRAESDLGWKAELSELTTIVESAWLWVRDHPEGYGD